MTADEIEDKLLEESAKHKEERQKASTIQELNEKEYGAGSVLVRDAWQVLLDKCDALRDERNMDIFITGHPQTKTVKPLDGDEYQRVEPMIEGQKSANLIRQACDYIVYIYQPIVVREEERSKKKTAVQGPRTMRCTPTATIDVKCRGDAVWPDTLPLDWDACWETFRVTAQLILDHGENVSGWLASEAARAFATIDVKPGIEKTKEERREQAEAFFLAAAGRRDYAAMAAAVAKADGEAAERAAMAKKANGVTAQTPTSEVNSEQSAET